MTNKVIKIKKVVLGNNLPLTLIAGPCQIESKEHAMMMASEIKKITDKLKIGFIFKSSFDKANRTSLKSKRGIGLEKSLLIFDEISKKLNLPILTDVHNEEQCSIVSEVVDIIQIPAFLCRQTDLLIAAARTQKIINVKKGQFLAPWDIKNVIKKIEETGNKKILVTERGVCFGYNTLITDIRSLPILSEYGYPVVFDATHSVQQPGGKGESSDGERKYISYLSRAAVASGISTVFIEVHNNPDKAPSDGPNMLPLKDLKHLLTQLISIDKIVKFKK
jgi:2-dehydro-3-deoxyphosphooctonate aldolase (KDO 8-P synthase)